MDGMRNLFLSGRLAACLALGLLAAGCASTTQTATTADQQTADESNDPWESSNRAMFSFNTGLDDAVGKPVARAYRDVVHQDIRDGIRNFVNNLGEPVNIVNAALQGKDEIAFDLFWRFMINSTLGIGGLGDIAANIGFEEHDEDFGQTLAVWGVESGPYVMLPLIGPTSIRGVGGKVVDNFTNPITYFLPFAANIGTSVADGIDRRERNLEALEDIEKNSLDYYAAIRSLYQQNRQAQVEDGEITGPILDIPVYAD